MNCVRCGFINNEGSRFCNNCAAPLVVPPTIQTPAPQTKTNWKPLIIIFAVIFGLSVILIGVLVTQVQKELKEHPPVAEAPAPPPDPEIHWNSTDGKIEAFVMSQSFLKRRLKSPSSADFPWYIDEEVNVVHRGKGVFVVKSYVDAQNSFGAKLRTQYTCELKDTGDKSWSLISLKTQ